MASTNPDDRRLPDEVLAAARDAHDALRRLQRAALTDCGYPADREPPPDLAVTWDAASDPDELARHMHDHAREATAAADACRPGYVYCYNCNSAACDHAAQPKPGTVFAGYANNGRPVWQELPNYLLALEDDRLDQLYDDRPPVLARVVGRKSLIADQLEAFGRNSMSYRIIGQLVAGYLDCDGLRCALTVQLVETKDRHVHPNVIAPIVLTEAMTEGRFPRLHDSLGRFRHTVEGVDQMWKRSPRREERQMLRKKLFSGLRRLANNVERHSRQAKRRTGHAQQRAREQRPVAKARDDLAAAGTEDFFRDTATDAIAVLGKKGRLHVFSEEGRHITSMILPGDQVASRQRRKRYIPLAPDAIATFRKTLEQSG